MTAIDIYGRWVGYVETAPSGPEDFLTKTHSYAVQVPPRTPLSLGMIVRVLGLSPTRYCIADAPTDMYDVYDAHLIGAITRVLGWKGDVVGLEVTNQCKISPVRRARLEVPYIPDATVRQIAGLRPGRGPRIATWAAFHSCTVRETLATEGRCRVADCAMRATALPGEGILDEYWLPGCREAPPRRKSSTRPKKQRGNLDALGWTDDDFVDSVQG